MSDIRSHSDPTARFTNRVDDYVRHRPRYPVAVIDVLRDKTGLSADWVIADIGAGTGISAEMFLNHGNEVFAVEPNDAMRGAAEKLLGANPRFHSVKGTAEATTLADRSVDLFVAAQAFHWFDVPAAAAEARRILRPGGWALLMWNDRQSAGSPFLEAYEKLLQEFGTDYTKVQHRDSPERRAEQFRQFFGGPHELVELENEQVFDFEGLLGRLLSSSYVPHKGDARFEPMLGALERLFDQHNAGGRVRMAYRTQLYFAPMR